MHADLSGTRNEWQACVCMCVCAYACPGIPRGPCRLIGVKGQLVLSPPGRHVTTSTDPRRRGGRGDGKGPPPPTMQGRKGTLRSALKPDLLPTLPALGGSCTRSPTTVATCTWWKEATSAASPTGGPTALGSSPSAGSSTSSSRARCLARPRGGRGQGLPLLPPHGTGDHGE